MGDLSQMWVGGVANSQTRSKHLKTPPNHPENRLFRPKFHLSISQISQKPWGGWVGKQIWERSPKKKPVFFLAAPLKHCHSHNRFMGWKYKYIKFYFDCVPPGVPWYHHRQFWSCNQPSIPQTLQSDTCSQCCWGLQGFMKKVISILTECWQHHFIIIIDILSMC